MDRVLRNFGTRGWKTPVSTRANCSLNSPVSEFKEHFEALSRDRYEEDRAVIDEVLGRVRDLRGNRQAVEANELLNEEPRDEEIEELIKEVKDSAPGEDGVRIGYILTSLACGVFLRDMSFERDNPN